MEADMDLETQLGQAMRSVAESVRPPVEDLVRGGVQRGAALRHRRARYGVVLAGGVGVGAAAIVAFGPRLTPDNATPAPAGSSSSAPLSVPCDRPVETGPLPDWASTGFSDPQAGGVPFVIGADGRIAAILFGQPLTVPEGKDRGNKILWVSRKESAPLLPLEIDAQLGAAGETVHRTIAGGPGPSSLELPKAGCWHLSLTWDGGRQKDSMDLAYVAAVTP
jgi:hypothetical protein